MNEFSIIMIIICVALVNFLTNCFCLTKDKCKIIYLSLAIVWNIFSIWCLTFIRL